MPRIAAWQILRSGSPTPLREVDRAAEAARLDDRDRALLRRLVGIELRRQGTLRALVRHLARRKLKPEIVTHVHLGLAQLFFLDRIPDHAAVSETVEATARSIGSSKVKVVNGILRNAIRLRRFGLSGDPMRDIPGREVHLAEPVFRDRTQHPYLWAEDALSIPANLFKKWAKRFGDERAVQLATYFLEEPHLSLRIRDGKRDAAAAELAALEVETREGQHDSILLCPSSAVGAATGTEAFAQGRWTIQGESALRSAELMQAQEGERLLDLCAAPGGKTAVLAESGASIVASDIGASKLRKLHANCGRLGITENVTCLRANAANAFVADAFDGVFIDAPCSNTGVLGARPSARWRIGPASMAELGSLQVQLLLDGSRCVRPGGRLVWSTCSLEPEENSIRVRNFLSDHPNWELEEELKSIPADEGPIDGGWAIRLRRKA